MRNSGRITKGAGAEWKATDRRIYNLLTHSPHYISELKKLVPESVPLILHGLSEEQTPASVSFIHERINEVASPQE